MKKGKWTNIIKYMGAIVGVAASGLLIWTKLSEKKRKKDEDLSKDTYEGAGVPVQTVRKTFYEKYMKRLIDIVMSIMGIIILSPVFIIAAVAIFITDPGPVIFTQKRVGINKTFFKLYKFRSMKMSTPHDVPTHMLDNPESYITTVGKFIRKTSIDELPQLFNILEGNLSVIGPRPALWNQEDLVAERDKYCANDVMPGLTGWAQINGRDELEIPVKAKLDGEYVERLSKNSFSGIMMDVKCFFGTIASVLKSDGVVEGGTGEMKKQERYNIPDTDTQIGFGEEVTVDFSQMKKVLITGANSYIGESFENYAKEHYATNFEIDTVDMIDGSWREKEFSEYDTVFHVAGIAHADVGNVSEEIKQKYYAVNTDLAIETAKKAKKDGVKQFVFMSSMIVYGESAPYGKQKMITADTKPEPANFYGDSKWQADKGVRALADENFNVLVLRPPMIYGKGSKGNYPILAKLAKKLPVFPDVNNQRSMLYIENLCEFLCQVMLVGKGGIFFPQNDEYTKTSEMVREISIIAGKKIKVTKLLNPFIWLASKMPGKIGGLVNKAFGNSCYDFGLNSDFEYCKYSFSESIQLTEGNMTKNKNICIVNCFDTYEHRTDLLYNFFKKQGKDVTVFTSNYRHIQKCVRTDEKKDYFFVEALPYKKNMSIRRMLSHYLIAKKIFMQIKNIEYDLVWVLLPPNSFAKHAALYRKKHNNTKLVFDLIDLWPETMPVGKLKKSVIFRMWGRMRDKYLSCADQIVTECDLYIDNLPASLKKNISCLYLARSIYPKKINNDISNDTISLCYLGSINNLIDIETIRLLVSRLLLVKNVELHIIGSGEKKSEFLNEIEKTGAKVHDYGTVYDMEEKQKIFDKCHYGLNIYKESVFVGLTMKSIDYFEAGLPIINNIKGDTWRFVKEQNIGVNLDENIVEQLTDYDCNIRQRVRDFYIKTFSVEEFEKKVQKLVDNM